MNRISDKQNNNYDYEIYTRDIFKILKKWKYTIISITLICVFLSGIFSFFIIDPVYEATTMVAPASLSSLGDFGETAYIVTDDKFNRFTDSKKISDNMDSIIKLAQVDVSHYTILLTSNYILQTTINKLGLEITLAEMKEQISVEPKVGRSDVSKVTVLSTDPELATSIANTLVDETSKYLNHLNTEKINNLLKNLENQQKIAQADLDTAFAQLKKHEAVSRGVANVSIQNEIELNKLQSEVKRKEDIVNSLSSKIMELNILQTFDSVEDKIVVLSAATVPEKPVKPNKKRNIFIAGVLGLLVSTFGVFMVESLRSNENIINFRESPKG
jgi:succinoglycan biosynthesis transport protein ExoP